MSEAQVIKQVTELPDSIEVGKAGARLKLYFNAADIADAKVRLANAIELMVIAVSKIE